MTFTYVIYYTFTKPRDIYFFLKFKDLPSILVLKIRDLAGILTIEIIGQLKSSIKSSVKIFYSD